MSLSEDDQRLLPIIGRSVYQNAMGIVVESATWGCYGLLFIFAAYIQISNGLKATRNKIMFSITCLLFASSTVLLALNITWAERTVHDILMVDPTESLLDKVDASNSNLIVLGTPMEGLFLLNMIIGDTIVIWRAYVIWSRRKLVILFPVLCLLASLGFAISDVICLQASNSPDQTTIPTGSRVCTWSEPLAWALSLLTNISSTTLIAMQAWILRKDLKHAFGEESGFSPSRRTRRAMALLVESGFIYCVFWISEIIIFFDIPRSSNAFYAYQFFASIGDQISGMYPTAIIVIVALQQSFDDTLVIASSRTYAHSGTRVAGNRNQSQLVFAVPSRTLASAGTDSRSIRGLAESYELPLRDKKDKNLNKSSSELEKGNEVVEIID